MDIKKILFKNSTIDVEKSLPDAIILCGKDGKIQWVNDAAAEIFETSKMHLQTSKITDFIENPMILIQNAINTGLPVIVKLVNNEVYFDMTVKEIEEGFVLDLRDSVPSKIVETDVSEKVNRDKNNFLIKLTNDLKSPIQSIVGFSQAMADGLGGEMSEQQEKYIRIINKNSTDLMYFVAKLLELSQTESCLRTPENKMFDILSLLKSVVRFNEQLYKGKDIRITVTQDEEFKKTITSDEDIIKNIFQNLLEVIFKSVDMGEIKITLSNPNEEFISNKSLIPGQYTLVTISSSSMLLTESDLECMFDPYKIVDTANRKNVLRAIVLASVKNLVQAINGNIWVESTILKHTAFNVLIPNL